MSTMHAMIGIGESEPLSYGIAAQAQRGRVDIVRNGKPERSCRAARRRQVAGPKRARKPQTEQRPMEYDTLIIYMREIGRVELLSRQEELVLARRVRAGDKAARERMIEANLRLVVKIAHEHEGSGLPLLDLIAEGNVGLMKAVDRFDPEMGVKFATYGSFWIKQSMRRAIQNQAHVIRVPVHIQNGLSQIQRAESKLHGQLHREPTEKELAVETHLATRQVKRMQNAKLVIIPLHGSSEEDDALVPEEMLADENARDASQEASRAEMLQILRSSLAVLNKREAAVIRARFGLHGGPELTLEEIGRQIGITREGARQVERRALKKIRQALDGGGRALSLKIA